MKKVLFISLLFLSLTFATLNVTVGDQGDNLIYNTNGSLVENADLTVLIYTTSTGGTPFYNETFINAVTNGSWNVMLGEDTPLPLDFLKEYYKDYEINGEDLDFIYNDGSTHERRNWEAPLGEIQENAINNSLISGSWNRDNASNYVYPTNIGDDINLFGGSIYNTTEITISGILNLSSSLSRIYGGFSEFIISGQSGRPYISIEDGVDISMLLKASSSEVFKVVDDALFPLTLFEVDSNGDASVYNNLVAGGNITADYFIGNGSLLTDLPIKNYWNRTGSTLEPATSGDDILTYGDIFAFNGFLDSDLEVSDEITSNRSLTGNYLGNVTINSSGVTLFGNARVKKLIWNYAYNIYGSAATYNGISCDAAGSSVVDDKWVMKTFGDGSGGFGGNPEAAILTLVLPSDYQAGENVSVHVSWTSTSTSGDVIWGVGLLAVGDGEGYDGTEVYQTTTETAPTTAYKKKTFEVTFSGTNFNPLDDVSIIIYRDAVNAGDTMTGDAYVSVVELEYVSNKLGEAI